ncbi:uncharacterized protein KY384_000378 [Bacidia gigantensis]|uniref:uncharacterized protein n=1 Tax=Bacidia gigantensis TaxID=2732470 RepID=UPI001D047BB1|nr:uncharacterized protein KY384_000378 [Bacidia gigantensis]KAG8526384.1 hypothetical protein KY384_000378 [Bacidia gigantensis]
MALQDPSIPLDGRCHLTRMPNEILDAIYVRCVEPNMALCSPILGSRLSSERVYQATILQSFWNSKSISHVSSYNDPRKPQPTFVPGNHVQKILGPCVPGVLTPEPQKRVQNLISSLKWYTFSRLEVNFIRLLEAFFLDFLSEEGAHINLKDQTKLSRGFRRRFPYGRIPTLSGPENSIVNFSKRLPDDKGYKFEWYYPVIAVNSLNTKLRISSRYLQPVSVFVLPDTVLNPRGWTVEAIQKLHLLCIQLKPKRFWHPHVHYGKGALYSGMELAIVEINSDALLILCWAAERLSHNDRFTQSCGPLSFMENSSVASASNEKDTKE